MSPVPDIAFCADDFTGACDTLATLVRCGLDARLHMQPPDVRGGSGNAGLDALGLAAPLRSLSRADAVDRMDRVAPKLAAAGASFHHFKVCSTFDSSPQTGNIAAAADAFAGHIGATWIAVVGGQPSLGRYCLFGNLFADMDGEVHRIDRHPVMRAHPITPMNESDLRRHFGRQGWTRLGLVPFTAYRDGVETLVDTMERRLSSGERQTLFDVSCGGDLHVIGDLFRRLSDRHRFLCVGASSVAEALYADDAVMVSAGPAHAAPPRFDGPVFAFSGSRSSVTAAQIERASGYARVPLTPAALAAADDRKQAVGYCRDRLANGVDVLAYLTDGPVPAPDGQALAGASAELTRAVLADTRAGCLAIAGGDTSSVAMERLGIDSLSIVADFDRGVPMTRAHATNHLDRLPVVLKGGQMGSPRFFEALQGVVDEA